MRLVRIKFWSFLLMERRAIFFRGFSCFGVVRRRIILFSRICRSVPVLPLSGDCFGIVSPDQSRSTKVRAPSRGRNACGDPFSTTAPHQPLSHVPGPPRKITHQTMSVADVGDKNVGDNEDPSTSTTRPRPRREDEDSGEKQSDALSTAGDHVILSVKTTPHHTSSSRPHHAGAGRKCRERA